MDVVLSEYLNKSHNFTDFIFYDVTHQYSLGLFSLIFKEVALICAPQVQVSSHVTVTEKYASPFGTI